MSFIYKENIGKYKWFEKETVTSTNDEIKELLSENSSVVLSAIKQTNGRGRRGRVWQPKEGNLYFTYIEEIELKDLSRAVCIIGLSLAQVIKEVSPKTNIQIKWPNDVYVSGKKISGILLENIKDNLWAIGIGVNIVSFPQLENSSYQATSLQNEGIMLDRVDFLHYYLQKFIDLWQHYQKNGFSQIKKRWLDFALNYQKEIVIKGENYTKVGIFEGIDDSGYLLLRINDKIEQIRAGDVFI